jgi:hypothetical protein
LSLFGKAEMARSSSPSRSWAGFLVVASTLIVAGLGCPAHKATEPRERESYEARRNLEATLEMEDHPDRRERLRKALAKLNDQTVDSVPVPVSAGLVCRDANEVMLAVCCLDEGRDLRGIHVMEKRTDPNGATGTWDRRYPIWLSVPETYVLTTILVPVEFGAAGRKENEEAWKDYEIEVLDILVHRFVYEKPARGPVKTPVYKALNTEMPPVLVPRPDADGTHIIVSLYDYAGNESESIDVDISPADKRVLAERMERERAQK